MTDGCRGIKPRPSQPHAGDLYGAALAPAPGQPPSQQDCPLSCTGCSLGAHPHNHPTACQTPSQHPLLQNLIVAMGGRRPAHATGKCRCPDPHLLCPAPGTSLALFMLSSPSPVIPKSFGEIEGHLHAPPAHYNYHGFCRNHTPSTPSANEVIEFFAEDSCNKTSLN